MHGGLKSGLAIIVLLKYLDWRIDALTASGIAEKSFHLGNSWNSLGPDLNPNRSNTEHGK